MPPHLRAAHLAAAWPATSPPAPRSDIARPAHRGRRDALGRHGLPDRARHRARASAAAGTIFLAYLRDLSERRAAERALAEREAQFRTIAETVPIGLVISEIDTGKPLYINPLARTYLGLGPDDRIDTLLNVWEKPEQRKALVAELMERGATGAIEADLRMAEGRRMKALVSATRIAYGGREAMLAATVDVTELRETEAALRESQTRFRAFMDFAPLAAHLRDADGRYLMFNRRMEELIGVPAAEALGKTPAELRPAVEIGNSDKHHRSVVETGKMHVSEQYLTYNPDDPRWAMAIRFPVLDPDGKVSAVGTFAVDITERKEAEAALKASEMRLNAINAANPVPMNIARLSDRKLVFVNEPYVRLYGLEGADLDTFDRGTLYPNPEDRERLYAEIEAGREINDFEITLRRPDGREMPVSLTSRRIMFQGEPAMVTTSVDLTALRAAQAEAARSREALHQSEKLTALGALLAGVAHELNNPAVGRRRLFLDAARDRLRPGDGARGRRRSTPPPSAAPGSCGPSSPWPAPGRRGASRCRSARW